MAEVLQEAAAISGDWPSCAAPSTASLKSG